MPGRDAKLRYLTNLKREVEAKAELYSPLAGFLRPQPGQPALLKNWVHDMDLGGLVRHTTRTRQHLEFQQQKRDYSDILTAFSDVKRAVLLGEPGAGKSTTLRRLAWELAETAESNSDAPVPVLIPLGLWTKPDQPLFDFIAHAVPDIGPVVEALWNDGRVALLLDGLNEIPPAHRIAKTSEVRTILESNGRAAPAIVSCRLQDYRENDFEIDSLTLEPLTPPRIREIVHHWVRSVKQKSETAEKFFWQLAGDEDIASEFRRCEDFDITEDRFWNPAVEIWPFENRSRHIRDPRCLMWLAANPFMLTMLYIVWVAGGQTMPRNRGELFDRFVEELLNREKSRDPAWQGAGNLQKGLVELAWRMQSDRVSSSAEDDNGVLIAAPVALVRNMLGSEAQVQKALAATLLEGEIEVRFRHQLFQEYFAAKALQALFHSKGAATLWPLPRWWERSGWEETAKLLAGFHSSDCTPVIRWLKDAQPEVAAQCLEESGAPVADRAGLLRELQSAWMLRLTDVGKEPNPLARAAVGRAIGRLHLDTRKGVGCRPDDGVPEINWVEIPAGTFVYQKRRRRNERFWIARYPVTNAQFQAFVDARDGYHAHDARWWVGLVKPEELAKPDWNESNHPRVEVDWYESVAFCRWLSSRLGREVRLPTEVEWERAASGATGRKYPWGDSCESGSANIDETWELERIGPYYVHRTTAVGIYPHGASGEGVLDLAGNVWEWCQDEFADESRALRGGSWGDFASYAAAAYRFRDLPDYRSSFIGFRLVVSSAPIL